MHEASDEAVRMRIFAVVILGLVALFSGGCSLFFFAIFAGNGVSDSFAYFFVALGTILCLVCIRGIRSFARSGPDAKPETDGGDGNS